MFFNKTDNNKNNTFLQYFGIYTAEITNNHESTTVTIAYSHGLYSTSSVSRLRKKIK